MPHVTVKLWPGEEQTRNFVIPSGVPTCRDAAEGSRLTPIKAFITKGLKKVGSKVLRDSSTVTSGAEWQRFFSMAFSHTFHGVSLQY